MRFGGVVTPGVAEGVAGGARKGGGHGRHQVRVRLRKRFRRGTWRRSRKFSTESFEKFTLRQHFSHRLFPQRWQHRSVQQRRKSPSTRPATYRGNDEETTQKIAQPTSPRGEAPH